MADLYDLYAQQTGADADLLRNNDPNRNNTTNTTGTNTGNNNTNDNILSEFGWDNNLPGTNGVNNTDGTNGIGVLGPDTPSNPTTPSTPTTTGDTTREQALAEFSQISQRVQAGTATPSDYTRAQELMNIINGGTGSTGTGTGTTGTGGNTTTPGSTTTPTTPGSTDTPGTNTQTDAWTEWQQIMARVQAGTATPEDYYRAQQLASILNGGSGTTGTGGVVTPGSNIPGSNVPGSNVFHSFPSVDMDNRQRINDMYDAQIEAQRAALQEQGDQALSDAQANRDKIAGLYNKQRNAASVDWERQRRNFLEGANTSGLNTGAGSQAELSMMSMYQRAQNDLGAAQAQAEAEADRNIADIKRSTQASINEAISKNDYQKAAALLDEYNEQYNRAVDRAEALAEFGDFSGYAALYGDDAAAQMRYTWVMNNPEIALATGQITQQQYAALTLYKQYPALALTGATAGGGSSDPWAYGGSGWNGGGTSTDPTQATNGNGTGNGVPSYSGMTPGTYAAYINSLVASGELTGAEGQALIREAYGQTG